MNIEDNETEEGIGELEARILKWLSRHGYPLEMEVAHRFYELGCGVVQADYYYDEHLQSQREIDLLVRAPRFEPLNEPKSWFDLYLTVEAKSSRDKPWILFTSDQNSMGPIAKVTQRFITAASDHWWRSHIVNDEEVQQLSLLSGQAEQSGYSLVRASMNKNTEDVAYAAAMSATRAAAGTIDWLDKAGKASEYQAHALVIPVIVVDAPLYKCYLDENRKIRLNQIDHGTLIWGNRISLKHSPSTIIEVVQCSAIDDLAAKLGEASKLLSERFFRGNRP